MNIKGVILGYSRAYIRNNYFLIASTIIMVTIIHLTNDGVLSYYKVFIFIEPLVDVGRGEIKRLWGYF